MAVRGFSISSIVVTVNEYIPISTIDFSRWFCSLSKLTFANKTLTMFSKTHNILLVKKKKRTEIRSLNVGIFTHTHPFALILSFRRDEGCRGQKSNFFGMHFWVILTRRWDDQCDVPSSLHHLHQLLSAAWHPKTHLNHEYIAQAAPNVFMYACLYIFLYI